MMNTDTIPAELRQLRQWIVWRIEVRNAKETKVPYRIDGTRASATEPADWVGFDEAVAVADQFDGIGFVFAPGGGIVGIDLDDCLVDGKPKPWAAALIDRFPTYAEVSPSGNGVKMWCYGKLPSDTGRRRGYRDGAVEMYDHARFFTVTGKRLDSAPSQLADCQRQVDGLYTLVFAESDKPKPTPPPPSRVQVSGDDQTIIDKLLAEHGDKAARLWSGDTSAYTSESEADAALCAKIAFYTGPDAARIERIFDQSCLVRGKWTDRADYRKRTIAGAIGTVTKFYDWTRPEKATASLPPSESVGLLKLIEDTISGKRKNAPWGAFGWLTRSARALWPGTVTVMCGAGGSTKSMFLSQSCLAWLQADMPFAVMHLEEDRDHHTYRALAQLAGNSNVTDDEYVRANPDIVRSAYEEHMGTLDALGSCIWDAPDADVSVADVTDWVRDRAKEGRRIIAVDPITAADSGKEPWNTDRKFVVDAKRIMRDHNASLIVITHPRDGSNQKQGSYLDNMAGGRAYNRFTTAVLWMRAIDDKAMRCRDAQTDMALSTTVNRELIISKTRNGRGSGWRIGFYFDPKTLCFTERGVILSDDD